MKNILLLLMLLALPLTVMGLELQLLSPGHRRVTAEDAAEAAVEITNPQGNSGGTGVILESNLEASYILTNKHICELVRNGGGIVKDYTKKVYPVDSFKESSKHDLCLLRVLADLKIETSVSQRLSYPQEKARISGHPHLYPTITTDGYFSERQTISVLMGLRPCTDADLIDPNTVMYCIFSGGVPVLKEFKAQLVSALSMPGSSGSAIYNSDGEIQALVFAGGGDLGYALAVPIEYVHNFLHVELDNTKAEYPVAAFESKAPNATNYNCSKIKSKTLQAFCSMRKSVNEGINNENSGRHKLR